MEELTLDDFYNLYYLKDLKNIKEKIIKICNIESKEMIITLLSEKFIFIENEIDKIKENNDFDITVFFKEVVNEFFDKFIEKKNNKEDLKNFLIKTLKDLYNKLNDLYISKEEGVKYCLTFNITTILIDLLGEDYFNEIKDYNDEFIEEFLENAFKEIEFENVKNEISENNNELYSLEDIFNFALKDKEKFENNNNNNNNDSNNNNNNNNNNVQPENFSEIYYRTSLFQ